MRLKTNVVNNVERSDFTEFFLNGKHNCTCQGFEVSYYHLHNAHPFMALSLLIK